MTLLPGGRDQQISEEHACFPRNEKYPRCVTCGREMGVGEADRAWFAARRSALAARGSATEETTP